MRDLRPTEGPRDGFNEAEAIKPRKLLEASNTTDLVPPGFNEAEAIKPRKQLWL